MSEQPPYTVAMRDRLENVAYRENGKDYYFGVDWVNGRYILYIDSYWYDDLDATKKTLTDEERARIEPRLRDFLDIADGYVYLYRYYYKDPITGKYEKVSDK